MKRFSRDGRRKVTPLPRLTLQNTEPVTNPVGSPLVNTVKGEQTLKVSRNGGKSFYLAESPGDGVVGSSQSPSVRDPTDKSVSPLAVFSSKANMQPLLAKSNSADRVYPFNNRNLSQGGDLPGSSSDSDALVISRVWNQQVVVTSDFSPLPGCVSTDGSPGAEVRYDSHPVKRAF